VVLAGGLGGPLSERAFVVDDENKVHSIGLFCLYNRSLLPKEARLSWMMRIRYILKSSLYSHFVW
jgi:hypothetical protein